MKRIENTDRKNIEYKYEPDQRNTWQTNRKQRHKNETYTRNACMILITHTGNTWTTKKKHRQENMANKYKTKTGNAWKTNKKNRQEKHSKQI